MTAPSIRLVIADDHAVLRHGLRMLLDAQPDMQVVAEAECADSAVARCCELRPDVVTLDLTMPGGGGLSALKAIREQCPSVRCLVLTMHDDLAHVRAVLDAGAAGYLAKRSAGPDLLEAVRDISAGRTYIRGSLGGEAQKTAPRGATASIALLSPREREVLRLLALGHSNREVALRVGVAKKSIDTYRLRMQEKLGIRGRAELVRCALSAGLLDHGEGDTRSKT